MKKTILSAIILMALVMTSCKKEVTVSSPYKIGEVYQGGVIVYIDQTGQHGLISSGVDIPSYIPFSKSNLWLNTKTTYGSGSQNTTQIIDKQGSSGYYAASWGVFLGWFLPSKEELNIIYHQKDKIKYTQNKWSTVYWSSSVDVSGNVWVQDFLTGKQFVKSQSDSSSVRGAKYF